MSFIQRIRREISIAWSGVENIVASTAEQTARQIEILRLSFQIREHEHQIDALLERLGRFLHESQSEEINRIKIHPICRASLSDHKRLQNELKFIERRRYDLKEENVATQWAEFVEAVHKNDMTLDSLVLPFHLKPSSMTLKELALPQRVLVIAIQRKERFIQPHGEVVIRRGDRLTLLGPPKQIIHVLERFSSLRES